MVVIHKQKAVGRWRERPATSLPPATEAAGGWGNSAAGTSGRPRNRTRQRRHHPTLPPPQQQQHHHIPTLRRNASPELAAEEWVPLPG